MLAEIRAGKKPATTKFGPHVDTSQAEYDRLTLQDLIGIAYGEQTVQISGPDWLQDKRFDIVAKMPPGASVNDAPKMLQTLLEDSFKLVVHRESRVQQALALEVDEGGPKLKAAAATPQPVSGSTQSTSANMTLDTRDGPVRLLINDHKGCTLESDRMTMAGLANLLTILLHAGHYGGGSVDDKWQVVVDMTGLKGEYAVALDTDFDCPTIERPNIIVISAGHDVASPNMQQTLDWAKEQQDPHYVGLADATRVPAHPSLFPWLQKPGLKLQLSNAPVEMLVVDHAEKNPTAN